MEWWLVRLWSTLAEINRCEREAVYSGKRGIEEICNIRLEVF